MARRRLDYNRVNYNRVNGGVNSNHIIKTDDCMHRLIAKRREVTADSVLAYCYGCDFEILINPSQYYDIGATHRNLHTNEKEKLYRLTQEAQREYVSIKSK